MVPSTRSKSQRAIRFLCGLSADRQAWRLCEQKEKRSERQETRSKIRLRLDFFAFLRLCEQKEERAERQEAKFNSMIPYFNILHSAFDIRH